MGRAPSHRLQWADLPAPLQRWIEETVGASVAQAEGQLGGYGPGMAARCALSNGRRVFVKAASPAQNPDTPNMMRGEAKINAALPLGTPAPALLHVLDDGEWVVLIFEDVDGRQPGEPWTDEDLRAVAALSQQVGRLAPDGTLPSTAQRYQSVFTGWRTLEAQGGPVADAWCRQHLSRLASLEARWDEVVDGDSLVHADFRNDNILLSPDRPVLVDWTATCRGADWFDLATILPSIEVAGGPPPEQAGKLMGLEVEADALTPLVAAFAGYFAQRSQMPDPPGLPTVRAFQRRQGEVTTRWLRRLVGWA